MRQRIEILLLLHVLAVFAAWTTGVMAEAKGEALQIASYRAKRKPYSTLRVGWEALARRWITGTTASWLDQLRQPPDHVLDSMVLGG